jgi:hypothetical protein
MASFTLEGITYEYLRPDPGHDPEAAKSWTYGMYPKVMATVPLTSGTVDVYAYANRWNPFHVLVTWQDDEWHSHWAWIPAGNVRRVTDSEWDIEEYRRCPEHLRGVQWGDRLPGFLPT